MHAKIQRKASFVASIVLFGAWACGDELSVEDQPEQELGVHQAPLVSEAQVQPAVRLPAAVDEKEIVDALARIDFACGVDNDGHQHAENRAVVSDLLSRYAAGDVLDAVINVQARSGEAFGKVLLVVGEIGARNDPVAEAALIDRFSKAEAITAKAVEQDGQPVPPEHARSNAKHLQVRIVEALAGSKSPAARGLIEAASRSAQPRLQEVANIALGRVR